MKQALQLAQMLLTQLDQLARDMNPLLQLPLLLVSLLALLLMLGINMVGMTPLPVLLIMGKQQHLLTLVDALDQLPLLQFTYISLSIIVKDCAASIIFLSSIHVVILSWLSRWLSICACGGQFPILCGAYPIWCSCPTQVLDKQVLLILVLGHRQDLLNLLLVLYLEQNKGMLLTQMLLVDLLQAMLQVLDHLQKGLDLVNELGPDQWGMEQVGVLLVRLLPLFLEIKRVSISIWEGCYQCFIDRINCFNLLNLLHLLDLLLVLLMLELLLLDLLLNQLHNELLHQPNQLLPLHNRLNKQLDQWLLKLAGLSFLALSSWLASG